MKQNCTKIIIFFTVFLLGFMGCSSTPTVLTGRYVGSIYDEHFDFAEDGTYLFTDTLGKTHTGTYSITNGKVILEGDVSDSCYIVENYLCILWDGSLPKDYTNTTISTTISAEAAEAAEVREFLVIISLKEDRTFTYDIYEDNQVDYSVSGTYTINQNKLLCTTETNETLPFFEDDGQVYFIAYTKE